MGRRENQSSGIIAIKSDDDSNFFEGEGGCAVQVTRQEER